MTGDRRVIGHFPEMRGFPESACFSRSGTFFLPPCERKKRRGMGSPARCRAARKKQLPMCGRCCLIIVWQRRRRSSHFCVIFTSMTSGRSDLPTWSISSLNFDKEDEFPLHQRRHRRSRVRFARKDKDKTAVFATCENEEF